MTSSDRIGVDIYQANVAAEYAAFLDQVPWYQFPYAEKRAGLMAVVRAPGEDQVRTSERKLAFGLANSIKQGYADLIKSALAATSDPAFLDIHVWAKGPVAEAIAGEPDTTLEKDFGADGVVFVTKRYQVFTDMIPRLTAKGVRFIEIGGNDEILMTVLSNDAVEAPTGARIAVRVSASRRSGCPPNRPDGRRAPVAPGPAAAFEIRRHAPNTSTITSTAFLRPKGIRAIALS